MSNANHYAQESAMFRSMVQQIVPVYQATEKIWESLDPTSSDWKSLSNTIRAAHTYAQQLVECVFGYVASTAELERSRSVFRGARAAQQVAAALQPEVDRWKGQETRWRDLAKQYGVTLCRDDAPDEIALLADAELLDAYHYRGTKLSEADFKNLVSDIRQRFNIGDADFNVWLNATGNA